MPPRATEVNVCQAPLASGGSFAIDSFPPRSKKANCTDCPCCLVFALALAATLVAGGFGFQYGNPAVLDRLVIGRDFRGRLCGVDHGVTHFKYAYFTVKLNSPPKFWTAKTRIHLHVVCTNSCPGADVAARSLPVSVRSSPESCAKDMYPKWCTWYGGKTIKLAGYCVDPDVFKTALPWEQYLQDIRASKFHLLLVLPVSMLVGFMFLEVMQKCGAVFVWTMLMMSAAVPFGFAIWLHYDATQGGSGVANEVRNLIGVKREDEKYVAIGLWAISGFILLLACCFHRSIDGIAAVVKGTSQFLKEVPSQMLQPVFFGCLQTVVIVFWFTICILVASIGAGEGDSQDCFAQGDMYCVKWDYKAYGSILVFLLLMLYWVMNFLHAWSQFGIAFAVGAWYFTKPDPIRGTKTPAQGGGSLCDFRLSAASLKHGLLHHSGSLAVGSFWVGFAKVCKLLLCWVTKEKQERLNNACINCLLRVMNALSSCMTRFIEFVSENAYVEIALTGDTFCTSAKKAMAMAVMRPGLFILVGRVALLARMMGTVVISMAGTYAVAMTLVWWRPEGMISMTAPVVFAAVCASMIAEVMMHPFHAAARACLHCYCLDAERAGMAAMEHTPQGMMKFVENHGQQSF